MLVRGQMLPRVSVVKCLLGGEAGTQARSVESAVNSCCISVYTDTARLIN